MPPPASSEHTNEGGLAARGVRATLGCIEAPAFPLQLLLRQRPEWRRGAGGECPVVVVDEDRPQGVVTHVNGAGRRAGIVPGQRYAHALGLAREVRAGVVPPGVVGAGIAHILARLRAFSPNIEPSEDEPGIFWIDVSGLGGLYDTLLAWAKEVTATLARDGFSTLAALGFSRFGTYAGVKSLMVERTQAAGAPQLARAASPREALADGLRVMTQPSAERALAMQVPLAYLAIAPGVRERLERLGVKTLGELAALPEAGVMKRWGPEALALHRLAQGLSDDAGREGQATLPGIAASGATTGGALAPRGLFGAADARLRPVPEVMPARARAILDFLEHDAHRLLFRIKSLLDDVVAIVRARDALIAELELALALEDRAETHVFRPAAPTLDATLLIDLVRLRLESVDLTKGLAEVRLEAHETPATPDQLRLFKAGPHQDGAAAARALARVQAELGEGAVGVMALRDAHLPRARQAFEPLVLGTDKRGASAARAPTPSLDEAAPPPLVRRLHARPEPLPPRPRDLRNDGWQLRDSAQGTIVALHGPFVVSGGWWLGGNPRQLGEGSEVHREYAFVETKRGDLLWIYHDRRRRRWLEEGRIE